MEHVLNRKGTPDAAKPACRCYTGDREIGAVHANLPGPASRHGDWFAALAFVTDQSAIHRILHHFAKTGRGPPDADDQPREHTGS